MTKQSIIAACDQSHSSFPMRATIDLARDAIQRMSSPDIDRGQATFSAEHYWRIFSRRLANAKYPKDSVIGIEESVEVFTQLPRETPLRLVVIKGTTLTISIWLDCNEIVVACIVHRPSTSEPSTPYQTALR